MREDWNVVPFGEVCEISGGSQPPKKDFIFEPKDGYIRLIQVRDYKTDKYITYIPKEKAKKFCTKTDIMIGRYGPPIFGIFSGIEGAYNVALMKAIPDEEKLDKDYFRWFLKTDDLVRFVEKTSKRAAGQDGVRKERLFSYPVPLPPLSEQKQIVALLDQAFTAIDQAKANIEKNIQNAQELIESYLQKTFIGNVSGSKHESLNDICELIVDCEHKTAPTQDTGYPSIRTPNIGFGELILDGVNRVSNEVYKEWTRRAIPKAGDLILAREAPAGNIGVIPENIEVCLGQRTVLIRPKKDKFIPKYLAYLILSKDVQKRLLSHSQGVTVGHINMRDIRAFKIFNLPSLEQQKVIVANISSILDKVNNANTNYALKLANVEELKKSILQKAFAGELTQKEKMA